MIVTISPRLTAFMCLAAMLTLGAGVSVAQTTAQTPPATTETKPAETKPAEAKPAETKPADTKPDTKPDAKSDAKPGDSQPAADAKPAETKPADAKPAETKPADAAAADPFGESTTLTARDVVMAKGTANWDNAFDTIVASLKTVYAALDKAGAKPAGNPIIVYTSTDDTGFTYQAEVPVESAPKTLPKGIIAGQSPAGKALKFVHRGSYDNMDNTYEAITNHLDDKKLEAQDMFIEEYVTDPIKTAEDKLIIHVFVPLK